MSRPSARAFWKNFWRSEKAFVDRCVTAVQNNITKVRKGQDCCGHPGEPGC